MAVVDFPFEFNTGCKLFFLRVLQNAPMSIVIGLGLSAYSLTLFKEYDIQTWDEKLRWFMQNDETSSVKLDCPKNREGTLARIRKHIAVASPHTT